VTARRVRSYHPGRLATLAGAAILGIVATVQASGPEFWTVATASEFLRGRSDGVYVGLDGVLTAAPQLGNRLTSAPAQVWAISTGADGVLWAGTGGDGRLIRLRPGQPEETVFDAEETNIFALAVSGSRVYAATGPDGRVYVIDGTAPARPFFDPEEKYIWALAVDGNGRLWVGAGSPGVIYRVEADGTGRAVYKPPVAHVVSLVRDAEGRILAGTESPGRLYRLDASDRPFVLLDSGLTELRAIAAGANGVIYAAAVARPDDTTPSSGETTSLAVTVPATPAPGASTASSTSTSATPPRRSIIYRIDPSGSWESIAETPDVIYDLLATSDGAVLAASGPEGRLYRVSANREVLLLTGVDARQITRFATGSTDLQAFATANPGRVMTTTGPRPSSPPSYLSPVRDTKSVSAWGVIRWEATPGVQLFTRSGNTDKPDDSWSDWAGPYTRAEGEAVKSPSARFVQWRAVLAAGSAPPRLTSVTLAYLPRNGRPEVTSITVHPPGVVFQRPFASEEGAIAGLDDAVADARRPPGDNGPPAPSPGRRMFQKSLQTLAWKADDEDGDHLSYTLAYRREGDQAWHDLRVGLTDAIFVWDTTSVADGRYIVRVSASDAPSNSSARALTAVRESDPIDIDNTAPVVTTDTQRASGGARIAVRVRDAQSAIQKVEYSIGGGAWQVVYPADGLSDSPDERYEIALAAEADLARLVVRATDALQNVTSYAVR
jgi:hypothetical protein